MKLRTSFFLFMTVLISSTQIAAATEESTHEHHMMMAPMTAVVTDSTQCQGAMEYWDPANGMCMPLAMAGMPMTMVMVHGNAFAVGVAEEGPRGRHDFAAPNMAMVDAGTSAGDNHYLNVELMATAELWTFPLKGYPELLQIGETDRRGEPFIDAQHPHSSPIMGLTLSDTVRLSGDRNYIKIFAAPRGASTDGPIAFMHRPTGMMNPDAPLGHHIGQDVGHISSTVVGAAVGLNKTTIEASTFSGREPEPTKVDLPVNRPDSYAARITQAVTSRLTAMISGAFIRNPEADDPSLKFVTRYSGSLYLVDSLGDGWTFYNSLIYGATHNYDHVGLLQSFAEEFLLRGDGPNLWGRLEVLQRTADELAVSTDHQTLAPRWVTAATLGYTQVVTRYDDMEFGIGGSVTKDFLPSEWIASYGRQPWTGKIFLQISGAHHWHT